MKNFLAILAVVLFATAAYAQDTYPAPEGPGTTDPVDLLLGPSFDDPYANQHFFSNFTEWGPRTEWYQNINYWVDYNHGLESNPFFGFDKYYMEVIGDDGSELVLIPSQNTGGLLQFTGTTAPQLFMWNSGVTPAEMYESPMVDPRQDQIDLAVNCDWMDYPEYVGCTSYFYLYVYRPLCVDCLCNNWMCLGIYSIPSYWDLPSGNNPFLGQVGKVGKYSCIWQITGQPYWAVVVSGEVIDVLPNDGVTVTWEWFGQNESFLTTFPGTNGFNFNGDFTTLVYLPEPVSQERHCTAYYYVGVVAKSVSVEQDASCGIKTFEATVSGIYYF